MTMLERKGLAKTISSCLFGWTLSLISAGITEQLEIQESHLIV